MLIIYYHQKRTWYQIKHKYKIIDYQDGDEGGLKDVTIEINDILIFSSF